MQLKQFNWFWFHVLPPITAAASWFVANSGDEAQSGFVENSLT